MSRKLSVCGDPSGENAIQSYLDLSNPGVYELVPEEKILRGRRELDVARNEALCLQKEWFGQEIERINYQRGYGAKPLFLAEFRKERSDGCEISHEQMVRVFCRGRAGV